MWILEMLNFKISRGSMPPDPDPSVLTPLALGPILAGPTLNCFRRGCVCVCFFFLNEYLFVNNNIFRNNTSVPLQCSQ